MKKVKINKDFLEKHSIEVKDGKVRVRVNVSYQEMPKKFYRRLFRSYLDLENEFEKIRLMLLLVGEYARKASLEAEINRTLVNKLEGEMAAMLPRYIHLLKSNRYLRNKVEELTVENMAKEELLGTYEELFKRVVSKTREADVILDVDKAVEIARRAVRREE